MVKSARKKSTGKAGGTIASPTRATLPLREREYPNRIHHLTKRAGLTYDRVAGALGVHYSTIANLAIGKTDLTLEWMNRLAPILGVEPVEIIQEKQTTAITGLRRVRVESQVHAGQWRKEHSLPEALRYDVLLPDSEELRGVELYGLAIRGPNMNQRYSEGATVVCSPIAPNTFDLIVGKRYHVRITRPNGECEETVRRLEQQDNAYWLRSESTHPNHQEWFPLAGRDGMTVQLLGRVRGAFQLE